MDAGSVVYVGEKQSRHAEVHIVSYAKEQVQIQVLDDQVSWDALRSVKDSQDAFHWIHVSGIHNTDFMNAFGQLFTLDSLLLEDILNTDQRPKVEELENSLFLSLKAVDLQHANKFEFVQISFVLTNRVLFTFSDQFPPCFQHAIKKLEHANGQIRTNKIDFLFYYLLDTVIDEYFLFVDHFNEMIDQLEYQAVNTPGKITLQRIQALKKEVKELKKYTFPLMEAVIFLEKGKSPFFQKNTFRYLKDLSDHIHYVSESVNSMRDSTNTMMELYLSNLNAKTNEIVKVLTLISSIFIPLTFIVGVYGMNFDHMPELRWQYGYYYSLALMSVLVIGMLIYFKTKKWL